MQKTTIEWARNPDGTPGYTWNPVTGCINHVNGFCRGGGFRCYAHTLANSRLKSCYLANDNWPRLIENPGHDFPLAYHPKKDPFYPRFWPERLKERVAHENAKERGIFVCDMGDLFGFGIPEEEISKVLDQIRYNPQDRYYLLTKQPQHLKRFSPFPDNCWVGATAVNAGYFTKACVYLTNVRAKVKYLSIEPYLGKIDVSPLSVMLMQQAGISWIIIGSQTNPSITPPTGWVESIVAAADKARVRVFMKDNLSPSILKRQEMPD